MLKQAQYTIRGIPAEVDQALRRRARQRRLSINQLVVEELTKAVSGSKKYEDFSDLVGVWKPDAALDQVLAEQRQVDREKWR